MFASKTYKKNTVPMQCKGIKLCTFYIKPTKKNDSLL